MNRTLKLILDIVMGAVIPILILNNLSDELGAVPTYVLAALVPVAWVFIDLLFISRHFNFITSYTGAQAIVRGLLAFWFVDGWQFALKDTAGSIVASLVFGGSLLLRRPMFELFWRQSLGADTPEREALLSRLTATPGVHRSLMQGTLIILAINTLTGVVNFTLNLIIVTASFGTEIFNQQVAQVNAITRIALTIPELAGFMVAFFMLFRAVGREFGGTGAQSEDWSADSFWKALEGWGTK